MADETLAITLSADIKQLLAAFKQVEGALEKVTKASVKAGDEEAKAMKKREVAAKAATRQMEALHKSQLAAAKGMASGMMGTLSGWAAGFGMTAGFVKAIDDVKEFDAALTDLRINGDKSAAWAKKMENAIGKVSLATGRSKMETLEYARAIIVQTGNAEVAMRTLSQMGDVALATGADFKSLGGVAVKLTGAMGISPDGTDLRKAFGTLHTQGKLGSIEFRAQSAELGRLFAVSAMLGKAGQGMGGVAGVGALFQLAARGKTPDQAGEVATSVERFLERLQRDPSKIESALGIQLGTWQGGSEVQRLAGTLGGAKNTIARKKILDKIFKAGGTYQYSDMETMAKAIGEGGVKDPGKFSLRGTELFGIEGVRVAQQLVAAARGGWGAQQGSLTSAAQLFGAGTGGGGIMRSAMLGGKDILATDAEIRRQSLANRWDVTMQKFAHTMHHALLPVFEELVKKGPFIADVFKALVNNFKYILAAWATMKTVGVLGSTGSAAASAAAGAAGGAGGAAGVGTSIGRAAANAFAFAPAMIMLGVKIGEAVAGTTIAKVRKAEQDAREELARGKSSLASVRGIGKSQAVARMLTTEWEGTTREGAIAKKETDALLQSMFVGVRGKGGHIDVTGLAAKGPQAVEAALAQAKSLHQLRVQRAEEAARAAEIPIPSEEEIQEKAGQISDTTARGKFTSDMMETRNARLARADESIAELTPAVKALEQASANLINGKVLQPIVIPIYYPSMAPGDRSKQQSGRSGNAMNTNDTMDDANFGTDQGYFGTTAEKFTGAVGAAMRGLK